MTTIALIVLVVWIIILQERISKLERFVGKRNVPNTRQPVVHEQAPAIPENSPLPIVAAQEIPEIYTQPSAPKSGFWSWLREDWMLKLGALLLMLGFGTFVTYAWLEDWVSQQQRVLFCLLVAIAVLIAGYRRMEKYLHQGGIFMLLGMGVLAIAVYADEGSERVFTEFGALLVLFLGSVAVALASVHHRLTWLSLSSLILASAAPIFVLDDPANFTLLSYLFVVVLGTLWVVFITKQNSLLAAALIITSVYSLIELLDHSAYSAQAPFLLLYAYGFATLFLFASLRILSKEADKRRLSHLFVIFGNALFVGLWTVEMAKLEHQGWLFAVWMAIYAVVSVVIYRTTHQRVLFLIYASIAAIFLVALTSVYYEGATLTIAYTLEAGLAPLLAYGALRDARVASRTSLLLIGPCLLALNSLTASAWQTQVLHKHFFVLVSIVLALVGVGLFLYRVSRENMLAKAWLLLGSVYGYGLLWLTLHGLFDQDSVAILLALVTYTLIGLAAYIYGILYKKPTLQYYGMMLLGFVLCRLVIVDLWNMTMLWRIVACFLFGGLLVSTAFLKKIKADR